MPASKPDPAFLAALGLHPPKGASVIFPTVAGIDWVRIAIDPTQSIVFVTRESEAYRLCGKGQPAIALVGIGKGKLAKWLRRQGANVHAQGSMN